MLKSKGPVRNPVMVGAVSGRNEDGESGAVVRRSCFFDPRTDSLSTPEEAAPYPKTSYHGKTYTKKEIDDRQRSKQRRLFTEAYQQFERPNLLGEKERRLVELGIAVDAKSEGGVRAYVRKLLGIPEEVST